MFGIYSNQRLSENERKILKSDPDDYLWYAIMLNVFFHDDNCFQVREDIEIPQKEDDDGVLLMSEGNKVIYFKTINCDVTEEVIDSTFEVCSYLEDLFNQSITSYVLFPPECDVMIDSNKARRGNNIIIFSSGRSVDGEKIIDRLEAKLKNHDEFTTDDSIDHMVLPYIGCKDEEIFHEKYNHYMKLIDEYDID